MTGERAEVLNWFISGWRRANSKDIDAGPDFERGPTDPATRLIRARQRLRDEPKSCPFCGGDAVLFDGYDQRSGFGDPTKGWIECFCGAAIGKPSPSRPYPEKEKAEVVRLWNSRIGKIIAEG